MIIDTHTHFYDPTRPQGVPWPPSDNKLLYRPVLPVHFKAVATPHGVTHTVAVEASPWREDNQWVLDLVSDESSVLGFQGNLNIEADDFADQLKPLLKQAKFKGIRARGVQVERLLESPAEANLRALVDNNLALDAMVDPDELAILARVAGRLPNLRIIIDHVAHVPITGGPPPREWVEGLRAAAGGGVYMKVSALAEMSRHRPAPAETEFYAPTLDALWEIFGEDRLVFGSNWPVCERAAPYETVFRIVDEYLSGRSGETRHKFFAANAQEAYNLTVYG